MYCASRSLLYNNRQSEWAAFGAGQVSRAYQVAIAKLLLLTVLQAKDANKVTQCQANAAEVESTATSKQYDLEVKRHNVLGQLLILLPIRSVQNQVDQVKARQQRGRQLDVVDNA